MIRGTTILTLLLLLSGCAICQKPQGGSGVIMNGKCQSLD